MNLTTYLDNKAIRYNTTFGISKEGVLRYVLNDGSEMPQKDFERLYPSAAKIKPDTLKGNNVDKTKDYLED